MNKKTISEIVADHFRKWHIPKDNISLSKIEKSHLFYEYYKNNIEELTASIISGWIDLDWGKIMLAFHSDPSTVLKEKMSSIIFFYSLWLKIALNTKNKQLLISHLIKKFQKLTDINEYWALYSVYLAHLDNLWKNNSDLASRYSNKDISELEILMSRAKNNLITNYNDETVKKHLQFFNSFILKNVCFVEFFTSILQAE